MLLPFFELLLLTSLVPYFANAGQAEVMRANANGAIVELDKVSYYVVSQPYLTVKPTRLLGIPPGFTTATSIRAALSPITKKFLETQFTLFTQFDDIWNKNFLETMFVSYDGPDGTSAFFEEEAERWLETIGLQTLYVSKRIRAPELKDLRVVELPNTPPAGPYFTKASDQREGDSPKPIAIDIHDVYRLHKDEYSAFVCGALPHPTEKGTWVPTNISLEAGGPQYIPVPSRMSILAAGLPLSGTRFVLKDIYDVKGLPTNAGSLAYGKVWPTPNETAVSVKKLIELGATLVGKSHTSQFAHGSQPWEFIDFPYSWNPRADGHLTVSASSSGSACAIAGYDWLDFTVGSDTRGSVRKPAALVGAFGLRPSHGSMDLTGVLPLSEEMDTAGFFSRDPRLFSEIGKRWFANSPIRIKRTTIRFPRKLLYPTDHFPVKSRDAQRIYDSFVKSMEKHLKMKKVPVDFTKTLTPYFPNNSFNDFQSYSNALCEYRSWHSVGRPLMKKHREMFKKPPRFDPRPREMFKRAKNITKTQFEEAVTLRREFKRVIAEEVIKSDTKSCSESIFIYNAGTGGYPSYRSEELNALPGSTQFLLTTMTETSKPSDFFTYVGSMAGLPEVTVPIGQVDYYSRVSKRWEMLPVTVQLVAHPGCDDMLLDVVKKLGEAGVIIPVKTGRSTF